MSDHKRVFGEAFVDLDAQAKEDAHRAMVDLHAHGIKTHYMDGGKIIEAAPGGSKRELDALPTGEAGEGAA